MSWGTTLVSPKDESPEFKKVKTILFMGVLRYAQIAISCLPYSTEISLFWIKIPSIKWHYVQLMELRGVTGNKARSS